MKRTKGLLLLAFSLVVVGVALLVYGYSVQKVRITTLRAELDVAHGQTAADSGEIEDLRTELDELTEEFNDLKNQNTFLYGINCIGYVAADNFKEIIARNLRVPQKIVNGLFEDPAVQPYLEQGGKIYQICAQTPEELSFVLYHQTEDYNNTIGIYTDSGVAASTQLFVRGLGDIGLCAIGGYIEQSVVFSCGGGDAGYGFNDVYVLDPSNNTRTIIKSCSTDPEKTDCAINTLQLGGWVF